eukprot:gnl/MRDRNA2_/MRDRNA2_17858_c0_seq1.p1 gnl/MRDRNA2_/MRDRNA2_17858_c0~~gnl/MRDRNA2_/MRDRNA2_17858_c0_seq1.p1  ORF type:complete len:358 (+),score=76.40 gnl/MRDRNA2_/MRDRNA2_17858_c0_seq1:122-1195(+)
MMSHTGTGYAHDQLAHSMGAPPRIPAHDQLAHSMVVPKRIQAHDQLAHSVEVPQRIQSLSIHDGLKNSVSSSDEQLKRSAIDKKRDQLKQSLSANQALQKEIKALETELAQNFPSVLQKQSLPVPSPTPLVCYRPALSQAAILNPVSSQQKLVDKKARARERSKALQSELEGLAAELSEITAFAQVSPPESVPPQRQEAATPPKRSPLPEGVFIPPLAIPHPKEHQPTPSTSSSEGMGAVVDDSGSGSAWLNLGDVGAEAVLLAHGGRRAWQSGIAEPLDADVTIDASEVRGGLSVPTNVQRVIRPLPMPEESGNPANSQRCPMCGMNFLTVLEAENHLDNCAEAATLRTGPPSMRH